MDIRWASLSPGGLGAYSLAPNPDLLCNLDLPRPFQGLRYSAAHIFLSLTPPPAVPSRAQSSRMRPTHPRGQSGRSAQSLPHAAPGSQLVVAAGALGEASAAAAPGA